jgi:hypothetical protein
MDALLVIAEAEVEDSGARARDVLVLSVDDLRRHLRDRPTVLSEEEVRLTHNEIVRAFAALARTGRSNDSFRMLPHASP